MGNPWVAHGWPTDVARSCWVGYSTRVAADICLGIYPTQLAGRFYGTSVSVPYLGYVFVVLSVPYPNPGLVGYVFLYLTQSHGLGFVILSILYSNYPSVLGYPRVGFVHCSRTRTLISDKFGTTLGTLP